MLLLQVKKNEDVDLTRIYLGGNAIEFRVCYGGQISQECVHGSNSALLARFYNQDDHNFYKKLSLKSRALREKQDW